MSRSDLGSGVTDQGRASRLVEEILGLTEAKGIETKIIRKSDKPRFTVATEGRNDLDLRGLCESFVNNLWIPDHVAPHQAAEYALDYFRRMLHAELKMLVVTSTGQQT